MKETILPHGPHVGRKGMPRVPGAAEVWVPRIIKDRTILILAFMSLEEEASCSSYLSLNVIPQGILMVSLEPLDSPSP